VENELKSLPETKLVRRHPEIRILFQDESRFGRINDEVHCWSPPHVRPEVGTQIVREFVYAMGAVDSFSGELFSLVLPWSDSETMSIFLEHTSQQFKDSYNLMFLDKAGWHTANDLRIPENIKLVFLPSYSPELNPMENIWKYLKENFFVNRIFKSLNEVEDVLCDSLRYIHSHPGLVHSITCYPWIKTISLTSD
jgi:hypothetical protein